MIVWWAPPEVAGALPAEIAGAVSLVGDASEIPEAPAAVILDTRALPLQQLIEVRAAIAGAVVICCDPIEADAVLELVGDGDDISIAGEPAQLVLERARRAARRRVSERDGLTDLANRRQLVAAVSSAIERGSGPLALIIFDVDHFKRINDTHGHLAGDQVLRALARRLERALGPDSLLARIGGEELAALVVADSAGATRIAEAALDSIRSEPLAGIAVTASAGVSVVQARSLGAAAELWRGADEALYAAKAGGRDRVINFDELRRQAAVAGRDLELDGFENRTRVLADKVADVIARRGRRLFEELKEQADVDALTGLFNRRYLDRRLELEVSDARAEAAPLSVALIDIDAFGAVNKRHGWPSGDRVLAEVAERIRANVRAGDWVARYGGEEICVVMLGTRLDQASRVLERIRRAIEDAPFSTTGGERLAITASLGAAELDTSGDSVAELLERASSRLLAAKSAGKNQVCV